MTGDGGGLGEEDPPSGNTKLSEAPPGTGHNQQSAVSPLTGGHTEDARLNNNATIGATDGLLNSSLNNNTHSLVGNKTSPKHMEHMEVDVDEVDGSLRHNASPKGVNGSMSPQAMADGTDVSINDSIDDSGDIFSRDDEARATGDLVLRVPGISKFKDQDFTKEKKILSDPVKIRCLPWRILFMLRLNNNQKSLGFFVQCNGDSESTTWNCHAKVELRLVAQKKGLEDVVRKIEHNFFTKENDWGFSLFISMAELLNPEKGYVLDDTVILKAHVVADAPHGVDWDSKRHTGFVGLKNQGATCYMNSLLQTLYFTNKLRKAVYLMPTESDDTARSVPLALQRVFYELQHNDKAVGTKKLTRSFGWETLDSFMQHDAQELCRVLMDNMESKMKGTTVEETIPALFRGKMLSYIKCKHVRFESKREENFYDIQLKVKGTKDIYTAFKEYVAVETLDADNKYDAGEHGLQEAEKGVTFVKFPPVLYLQLMRFQYDHITDANIKINDKFEFPYHLDLDQFLLQSCETPARYFLHAVLVHSGDNHGGHYVVYLNPAGDNTWYKFDDDVVSRCSRKEAITLNYGGYEEDLGVKLCTNAYMLVYIAEASKEDVLSPVEDYAIPETLRHRFNEEKRVEIAKRREKSEAHLYASVNLILDEDFYGWQGFDLYNVATVPERRIRVLKNVTMTEFLHLLANILGQKPDRIRPWPIQLRKNQTNRVTYLELKENFFRQDNPILMWIQTLPPDSLLKRLPNFDMNEDLLVFLKYYQPRTQTIHYCGTVSIRLRSHISFIIPTLLDRAGLDPSHQEKLILFEERKPQIIERMTNFNTPVEDCFQDVMDGNIIVFQQDIPASDLPQGALVTAADFFKDYYYRIDVLFVDKRRAGDVNENGFVLNLSLKHTYWQIAEEVGHYLDIDSTMLQFFRPQSTMGQVETPGQAIRCSFDGMLKELVPLAPRPKQYRRLYYHRLAMPITDLENMRQFRGIFVNNRLKEVAEIVLNVSKSSNVKEMLEEARKQVELAPNGSGRLRLLEVSNCKIMQEIPEEMKVISLNTSTNKILRVEEVPLDELDVQPDETVVYVAHFHKETQATFGVPFTLKLRNGESFSAIRERIQQRLDVSDKEFEKWRFAVMSTRAAYFSEDSDQRIEVSIFNAPINATGLPVARPWLGLEHKNPPKRARYTFTEKAIKIHN